MRETLLSLWWTTARFIPAAVTLTALEGKETTTHSHELLRAWMEPGPLYSKISKNSQQPVACSLGPVARGHGMKDQLKKPENSQKLQGDKVPSLRRGGERSVSGDTDRRVRRGAGPGCSTEPKPQPAQQPQAVQGFCRVELEELHLAEEHR